MEQCALNRVAQVERRVFDLGRRKEVRVDALEGLASSVVGALDGDPAGRVRHACDLHAPEALPRPLRLLEQLDVDLAAKYLMHATHVAAAARLVVVEIEVAAPGLHAARGIDDPVAEAAALPAL